MTHGTRTGIHEADSIALSRPLSLQVEYAQGKDVFQIVSPCSVKTSLSPAWGLQLSSEGRCQQAIWKSVCGHSPLSKYDCSFHCLQFMFKGKSWALLSYVLAEGTLSLVGGIRQWSRQGLAGREATGMACPGLQVLVHSGMSKGPHCTSARPWSCPSANL